MSLTRFLIAFATITISSGCCTLPEPAPLPMPARIPVIDWTDPDWDRLEQCCPDLRDRVDYNSEAFKQMIVEREAVIRGHNEALQD